MYFPINSCDWWNIVLSSHIEMCTKDGSWSKFDCKILLRQPRNKVKWNVEIIFVLLSFSVQGSVKSLKISIPSKFVYNLTYTYYTYLYKSI